MFILCMNDSLIYPFTKFLKYVSKIMRSILFRDSGCVASDRRHQSKAVRLMRPGVYREGDRGAGGRVRFIGLGRALGCDE